MVKFAYGTYDQYQKLPVKDFETIYFIEDLQRIYKGEVLVASNTAQFVESLPFPDSAVEGILYINKNPATGNYDIHVWDGTQFVWIGGGGTSTSLEDRIRTLEDEFHSLGTSVVDGMLCVTYTSEE